MSDENAVVERVGDLMKTLDDVRRYREIAYAMVDFLGIVLALTIVVILIYFFQGLYDVTAGFPLTGTVLLFGIPTSTLLSLIVVIIELGGVLGGVLWVSRRVDGIKKGEWTKTLDEGVPGAVKLLSEMDWEEQLSVVSTARIAYLFYAVIKTAAYSFLVYWVLLVIPGLLGLWFIVPSGGYFLIPFSIVLVLIVTKKSLQNGFARLRSLSLLFWDLRGFYSDFKSTEFINKA